MMFRLANYADPASVAAAGCTSSKKRKLRRLCARRHDLEKCAHPDEGEVMSRQGVSFIYCESVLWRGKKKREVHTEVPV